METKNIDRFVDKATRNHFVNWDTLPAIMFKNELRDMCFKTDFQKWNPQQQEIVLNALAHVAVNTSLQI